jgi:hypothetical protein
MQFLSFYYPGFTSCRRRNDAAGVPIDEWALVRDHPPSVFGESGPVVPALGYGDSSDASYLRAEAACATAGGIDGLVFNFHHDGRRSELETPLKVYADHIQTPRFAINFICRMPRRILPFGLEGKGQEEQISLSEAQFEEVLQYLAKKYFTRPNYLQVNGRAIFTMYHVEALLTAYGPDYLTRRLNGLRELSANLGRQLYIVGLFATVDGWRSASVKGVDGAFNAFSCYIGLPDYRSDQALQQYDALAGRWTEEWSAALSSPRLVVHACVGAGWDATARGCPGYDPSKQGLRFPYYPVVQGSTPDAFERYLRAAVSLTLRYGQGPPIVFLGPFNEWSEGCFLLPDSRFGLARLQAVQEVKRTIGQI